MIACIRIPVFAITVARSTSPDFNERPLILARYKGRRGIVYAACETAIETGVKVGMSLSRARALCSEAAVETGAPSQTRRALDHLLETLSAYSQWLEVKRSATQTAIIYIDLGTLRPKDGEGIAQQIIESLQQQGFRASIGLATGKFTAYVAAAVTPLDGIKLVHKGEEAVFLAPLSTAYLPLSAETSRRFELFGLRRVWQVLRIPRDKMIAQFGKAGGQIQHLALGEDNRRVEKYIAPLYKTVFRQFEPPLADRLILESTLAAMVSDISDQLLCEGMAGNKVLLTLHLDNHTEHEVERLLHEPVSSKGHLYRMVQPLIAKFRIFSPVTEISLRVDKLAPIQPRQLSLFDQPQASDLENTLIELSDRYDNCFYRVEIHGHPSGLPELQFHLSLVEAA